NYSYSISSTISTPRFFTFTIQIEKDWLINSNIRLNYQIIFYLRSKNSEKYFLPEELINYSDLKVSFIRILYNDKNNILIKEENELNNNNICQLKSELNYKETSKYLLPSTTPHPLLSTTTSPTKYSPSFTLPDIFSNSILNNNLNIPSTKIQYKRNYNKLPRRSTKTAQNYLTVNHYINTKNTKLAFGHQNNKKIFPSQNTINWSVRKEETLNNQIITTTPSYIDIIKDKQLYEEIQKSKTMEINSRWSLTFLIFVVLISVLISISATFALIMFILLQCRPKNKKTYLISHSP
ncbi:hypothetical protein Mgra_00006860, partial [Meloidogyne graminicola]